MTNVSTEPYDDEAPMTQAQYRQLLAIQEEILRNLERIQYQANKLGESLGVHLASSTH